VHQRNRRFVAIGLLWGLAGALLALALFLWRMWPELDGRPPPQTGDAIRIVPMSQR
jgi:hypothetical protein